MIRRLISYLKGRVLERSTLAAIALGITGAAAIPEGSIFGIPYSALFLGVSVVAALVPDGTIHGGEPA